MNWCDLCGEWAKYPVTLFVEHERFDGHERCMEQMERLLVGDPDVYTGHIRRMWPPRNVKGMAPQKEIEPTEQEWPEA